MTWRPDARKRRDCFLNREIRRFARKRKPWLRANPSPHQGDGGAVPVTAQVWGIRCHGSPTRGPADAFDLSRAVRRGWWKLTPPRLHFTTSKGCAIRGLPGTLASFAG